MEADFSVLFLAISGYATLTEIQNLQSFEVVSTILISHHHLQSQAVDPFLAWTTSVHLAYSQRGRGSILSQFEGLVWLGSNAQTLLKAEVDATFSPCTSREKEDPSLSRSKPLLMFEMCQIRVFAYDLYASSLPLNAATLSADLYTVAVLSEVTD